MTEAVVPEVEEGVHSTKVVNIFKGREETKVKLSVIVCYVRIRQNFCFVTYICFALYLQHRSLRSS